MSWDIYQSMFYLNCLIETHLHIYLLIHFRGALLVKSDRLADAIHNYTRVNQSPIHDIHTRVHLEVHVHRLNTDVCTCR